MLAERTHIGLCLATAAGLFDQAVTSRGEQRRGTLLRMAADVIDRTEPGQEVLYDYAYKPAEQSDVQFLAERLDKLHALPPERWPSRKVKPAQWGEFTRIMRGLDERLGVAPVSSKEATRNRAALREFVAAFLEVLPTSDQAAVADALTPESP